MAAPIIFLLCLLLAFDASEALLYVTVDPSLLVVKPGDTVQLKCLLKLEKQVEPSKLMVQWFTRGVQVAEYDRKVTIDKPGLSLSEEALKKGDATLTISSVKEENAGNYRCYVYYGSEFTMKQIVLKVEDPNKPKQEEEEILTDGQVYKKIFDWMGKLDGKVDELLTDTKKCFPQRQPKSAK
ncbi:uncharacterized protein LOC108704227 [Xenopus laevis]|uniref:Uncharacterized protein LOC108704227 n=1 Tax=Xenopus laevis TaxID=8355 RepID=A0A8J0U4U7_XENLA|nr:uncharacterized protein LOC108704227 [Xenopus laevis]OCT58303.1 hypothetical protein XELAEV_18002241mg [Xenopus laevis]